MKKIYSIILVLAIALVSFSCTSDYDEMNENPNGFTELSASDIAGLFNTELKIALCGGGYQLNQGLHQDFYSQYYTNLTTYFSSDRYDCNQDWEDWGNWLPVLNQVAPYSKKIYEYYDETTAENAMARICYVAGMEFLADCFGAIPYDAGSAEQAEFVDNKTAYHNMLDDLTKAATALKTAKTTSFDQVDRIYEGDCDKWLKLCNTIRMRIGMRLVNQEPEYAQSQVEAAYNDGVMTTIDDEAWFTCDETLYHNDLSQTANWNEYGMSSTIYSYMMGWNDPRVGIYFQVSPSSNTFHCTRNGMPASDIDPEKGTDNTHVSNIGTNWVTFNTSTNVYDPHFAFNLLILPAADAYFLRAEGALRGWNMGGSAQELYEEGIRMSMKSWGVSDSDAEAYLQVTSDPVAPNDYYNSPAVCTDLPVKYDASASFEKQLQQIITQRWLSLYTCSNEAWALIRRSGYPILYPIIKNDDYNEIPEGSFIQRIWYPSHLQNSEGEEAMQKAYSLNGSTTDSQGTKLYFAK